MNKSPQGPEVRKLRDLTQINPDYRPWCAGPRMWMATARASNIRTAPTLCADSAEELAEQLRNPPPRVAARLPGAGEEAP